jgi:hypothetical protein
MNNDHKIWRTNKDHWIRAIGQQTTSAKGHMTDHISKSMSIDHVSIPCQKIHMESSDDDNHQEACVMSTSDISKLRHSGRIASGVSNVKIHKFLKNEDSKSLSFIDIRYYPDH